MASAAGRFRQFELDARVFARCAALFTKALEGGRQLSRPRLYVTLKNYIDLVALRGRAQERGRWAERYRYERLRLAACEQRGTVGSWKDLRVDRDRANILRTAAIDALVRVENL